MTTVVYPGVVFESDFKFLRGNEAESTWLVMIISAIFSVFDLLGRVLAERVKIFNDKTIIILTLFRGIFIASMILVAKEASPSWIFDSDVFKIINLCLFTLTNGYNCTALMVIGPNMVSAKLKEKAGMIMN